MAVIETWLTQDLKKPVPVQQLCGNFFSHNGNANRIGVRVYNGDSPASLSGTVSGYAVLTDGTTVPCTGSLSGNEASILLPAAAYVPGNIFITIMLTSGTTITTLAALAGNVVRARTDSQVDPGSVVTDWTNTINAALQTVENYTGNIIATPYASLTYPVPLGKYCIYNNLLYRCVSPIASSENWTASHWTQVKLADDVSDLKSAFDLTLVDQDASISYTKGSYWQSANGNVANSNKYARTTYKIYGYGYKNAVGLDSNTYIFGLVFFDGSDNVVGNIKTSDLSKIKYIPKTAIKYVVNIKREDNTNLSDADFTAIEGLVKHYALTDKTLLQENTPADAKATGEALTDAVENIEKTFVKTNGNLIFESGTIDADTGEFKTSTTRLRTLQNSFFRFNGVYNTRVYFSVASGFQIRYMEFSGVPTTQSNYTDNYSDFASGVGNGYWTLDPDKYYQFMVKKTDGSTIAVSDVGANDIILSWFAETDKTLSETNKSADAESSGHVRNSLISSANILYNGQDYSSVSLEGYSISFSTGARSENTTGRLCSCGYTLYKTDMMVLLGLPEYRWHAWSYRGMSSGNATHSNTEQQAINGTIPIFIKKNVQDRYFNIEFRRADGAVLTTDTSDPTSDYYKISHALKFVPAMSAPQKDTYDGFIFRLENEPSAIPIGDEALGYNDFIEQTWDHLSSDYTTVTKSVIGTSTTTSAIQTEYNIYKYVFEPPHYEKTVFLSAGCHGNEYEGFWGLYRLMRLIYDYGYKYPNLRKLRHKVRFIIVPVWNPWGVQNKVRNCPLGCPTQDNMNSEVTVDGTTYPAFTSKECQAIKAIFDEYEGELSLWVDLHTDPFSVEHTWKKGLYGYAEEYTAINRVLYGMTVDFRNILRDETGFRSIFTIYNTASTSTSSIPGYGNYRGVSSAVIEASINEFAQSGTSTEMKYAIEWYGNVIANMIEVT